MSLLKMARRLLTRPVTPKAPVRPITGTRLGVEQMEDRVNPVAVIAPVADANGVIQVVNAGGAATITIRTEGATGLRIQGTGAADVTYAAGTFRAVNVVAADASPITVVNPAGDTLAGVTGLRQIAVTGNAGNDTFNFLGATNPNVYYRVDLGSGANTFVAADGGVNLLSFTQGATGSVAVTTSAANARTALSFRNVTDPVSANLNVTTGGSLANYGGMNVTLAGGANTQITGVYGGAGNDTLIGNNVGNILVGGAGNDNIVGNGGDDQLNANRDFSPSMPGLTNVGGVATINAGTVVDVSQFAPINTAFAGVPNQSPTAAALFAQFGFFGFGEGVAALGGAAGVNSTSLAADFASANAAVAAASDDTLVGGDGNDGHYGFNNARVSATGGIGNDVFSTNVGGLASTYDGGDGNDLLIGAPGFTLLGGANDDNLSFAVADVNAAQPRQSTAIGGPGNDTISASFLNVLVDAGEGLDTVTLANSTTNTLVFTGDTNVVGGIDSISQVNRVRR
jgi:Ca2+-binding RTX toxin-like protein